MRGVAAIDRHGLSKAMELGGWQSMQLAEAAGISPQYMTDILKGRRTLKRNPDLRKRLAAALGVPLKWIVRDDNEVAS